MTPFSTTGHDAPFAYFDSRTWSLDKLEEERSIAAAELGVEDDGELDTHEFFLLHYGADNGFTQRAKELLA